MLALLEVDADDDEEEDEDEDDDEEEEEEDVEADVQGALAVEDDAVGGEMVVLDAVVACAPTMAGDGR